MKTEVKRYILITLGSILFASSINLFLVPCGLYNGGIVGSSQLIRTLIINFNGKTGTYDYTGIINLCLNIPLFILAYRKLSPKFVYRTIYSVIIQTIIFSAIPLMSKPLISDRVVSILIGTILSAYGSGLILVQKASSGGIDILGMVLASYVKKMSVGKLNLFYNVVLYTIYAFIFNLETAIYSVTQMFLYVMVVDKVHLQNIEVSVMIFTKNPKVKKVILDVQQRGVTYWQGMGAYTDTSTEVLVSIVSKFEVADLRAKVKSVDPQAFIIVSGQLTVDGRFEKRLI